MRQVITTVFLSLLAVVLAQQDLRADEAADARIDRLEERIDRLSTGKSDLKAIKRDIRALKKNQGKDGLSAPAVDKRPAIKGLEAEIKTLKERIESLDVSKSAEKKPESGKKGPRVTFGGQFRVRYAVSNIESYGAGGNPPSTDDDLLFRTRLNAKASPFEDIGVFIELQDSREAGTAPGTDTKNVDLLQGYMDLKNLGGAPVALRVGRFKMKYGSQRMVSSLEWSNISRTWEGARLHVGGKKTWVDAFATNIAEAGEGKRDTHFWGLYSSLKLAPRHSFDLYFLNRDKKDVATGSPAALSERTAGFLAKGKTGGLDYSAESAYQFGRRGNKLIDAYAVAIMAGYTADITMTPRVEAVYDIASGDNSAGDNKDKTFRSPFPFGHAFQGHADVVGWRNLNHLMVGLRGEPVKGVRSWVRWHHFRRAHSNDDWYTIGNAALRGPVVTGHTSTSRDLGEEIDFFIKHKVLGGLKLWYGYSYFAPGRFIKETGFSKSKHLGFINTTLNF